MSSFQWTKSHLKCARIVGRLSLQVPSIHERLNSAIVVIVVAVEKVRHGCRIICSDEAEEYKLEFVARTFEFVIAINVGDRYVIVDYWPPGGYQWSLHQSSYSNKINTFKHVQVVKHI